MLSRWIQRVALHALASSKKTTATPCGMTFGEDWDSVLPGASKEEAKKIFDLFASEGALFGLSPIIVPLVREGPLKPLSIFQLEDLDFLYRRSPSDHGEYRY